MEWTIEKRVISGVCLAVVAGIAVLVMALIWSYNENSQIHMESRSRLFTELVSAEVSPGLYTQSPAAIKAKIGPFIAATRESLARIDTYDADGNPLTSHQSDSLPPFDLEAAFRDAAAEVKTTANIIFTSAAGRAKARSTSRPASIPCGWFSPTISITAITPRWSQR